jgi:Outer membrane protein beta-barrel domain
MLPRCFVTVLLILWSAPAYADATAFVGVSTSPESRRTLGLSLGTGLLIVGFEFEYAHTTEDLESEAPSMRTFMGNVLVQTPIAVNGFQLYATAGGGVYRERFELADTSETNLGTNFGGGVKMRLIGPLRLRLDYRVFKLHGSPVYDTPQRFYAGLNVAF